MTIIKGVKMKLVIRRGIFESNSSTTHSCVIMMESNYYKWQNGGYVLRDSYSPFRTLPEDKKPRCGILYTTDEVIELYKLAGYEYNPEESSKEEFIDEMGDFITFEQWYGYDDLEHDENYFTTPNGEKIIVCCKYGVDY